MAAAARSGDLSDLIGEPATHALQKMATARLWGLALTAIGIVLVVTRRPSNDPIFTTAAILAFVCAGMLELWSMKYSGACKRLANDHLTETLGFQPRPAAFMTRTGWQTYIARERQYHDAGSRPKFSITFGAKSPRT